MDNGEHPQAFPPAHGLKVVDLTCGHAATISRLLAELGAEVIRIEPPGGSDDRRRGRLAAGVSLDFVAANLGKQVLELDIHEPASAARLEELLRSADLMVDSFRPGSAAELVAGARVVTQRLPQLVGMSVTPFGHAGGCADWAATDPVLHALSGELSRSGLPSREPLLPPGQLALECAAAQGAFALLLAHANKLATGLGDWLDFSLLEGAVQALDPGFGVSGTAAAGVRPSDLPRGRVEARFRYPIIRCSDGHVRICILSARQWQAMFEWMGRPAQFADPSYNKLATRFACPDLIPAIGRFFADQGRFELERSGQERGVPIAAVLAPEEAIESPQHKARGTLFPLTLTSGIELVWPASVFEIDGRRSPPVEIAHAQRGAPRFATGESLNVPIKPAAQVGLPLEGLRVLDLGVIVVGAETARLLADAGADVVKVENAAFPDGLRQNIDGMMSPSFAAGHRNKRSLVLNLRDPAGRNLFRRLIKQADVLLSNFKPGVLESLGFDQPTLNELNPALISIDSSAFGSTGPWSSRMGYGPLVRAWSGITEMWSYTGEADSYSDAITVYPDHVAARLGAVAALSLLLRRAKTGRGGRASISQAEVILSHGAADLASRQLSERGIDVVDKARDTPCGVYRCAGEDEWCVVTVRDDRDWPRLAPLIGLDDRPELRTPEGRLASRALIDSALETWLATKTPDAAMKTLQQAGVPAGAMLRVSELPEAELFQQRRFFSEAEHPELKCSFTVESRPVVSRRLADPPQRPAPLMGEHSLDVLMEWLGLTGEQIEDLLEAGIVGAFRREAISARSVSHARDSKESH